VCVCSLIYPSGKTQATIVFSSVVCPALSYYSTLSHERHFSEKKLNVIFVFYTSLSEIFLILGRIQRNMIINLYQFSCNVLILVRFLWNLGFLDRLSKKNISLLEILSSSCGVVPCGQTDMHCRI